MLDFARRADAIAGTSSTLEKARLLADYLRDLPPDDVRRAAVFMSGQAYGRAERRTLNLGWATIGRVVERISGRDPRELSASFLRHSDLGDWALEALTGCIGAAFFLANTVADHGRVRLVEPNTVIEVAFDAIMRSNRHRSGFALRFPRIVRLRPDKPVSEIDTLARVEELYDRYFGRAVPLAEVAETP